MTVPKHFQFAPFGWLEEWRKSRDAARRISALLCVIWCVLGTPFWIVACFGYVFCLLFFPTMLLGFGLSLAGDQPGVGWFIFAGCVLLLWTALYLIQLMEVIRQIRARV